MFGVDRSDVPTSRIRLSVRIMVLALTALTLEMSGIAAAQVGLEDYPKPILVRNGSSHFATIKDLAFIMPGGKELLSAGFDKVIHVWDLQGRSNLPSRTIRQPIFRGDRGQIWSIALSPAEVDGQRLLAVGGLSPGILRGTIVLMRYPGKGPLNAQGTGEILGYLQKHSARISKVAFDKKGRHLVSTDMAGSIQVWDLGENVDRIADVSNLKPIRSYENGSAISGMVLSSDDRWIVTGDFDGNVRRWDRTNQAPPVDLLPGMQPGFIRGLAGSQDLRWVVAASSGYGPSPTRVAQQAALWQVFIDDPSPPKGLSTVDGNVLAIDVSADGRKIAVSEQKRASANPADPPPIDSCAVKVYDFDIDAGKLVKTRIVREARYPIEAVRFGPDSSLAIGGDATQVVSVRGGANFDQPRLDVSGEGSVIWDVGFVEDGKDRAIAFSRSPQNYGAKDRAGEYEGFNLTQRLVKDYPATSIFRPDLKSSRVEVLVLSPYRFRVSWPGVSSEIALDPQRDGRWYSYLLLPSLASDYPLLAVGTDSGISVFNARHGRINGAEINAQNRFTPRTRFLAGHEDRVTALGISSDRKWLVSGSVDQSIRFWEIKDFERPTGFGASGQLRPDGDLEVTNVIKGSDADQRGLQKGDRIKKARIERIRTAAGLAEPVLKADFFDLAEALPPDQLIELEGTRVGGEDLNLSANKRQSPTLSLFTDQAKQDWVFWEPRGNYATSIQGDDRYLGWHQNQMKAARQNSILFPDTEKTIFNIIGTYKQLYENRVAIGNLVANTTPVPPAVPPPVQPIVPPVVPPKVLTRLLEKPAIETLNGDVFIHLPAEGGKAPRPDVVVLANSKVLGFEPPNQQVVWEELATGWRGKIDKDVLKPFGSNVRVWAQILDPVSPSPPAWVDVEIKTPASGRLVVFGCGAERLDGREPKVKFAERDVEELAKPLVDGLVTLRRGGPPDPRNRFLTSYPTIKGFREKFDELKPEEFQEGDMFLAILEAQIHFISNGTGEILLNDSVLNDESVTTREFQEKLEAIARTGCRVFLFLDDVHDTLTRDERELRHDWLRRFLDKGVSYFQASEIDPSWPRFKDKNVRMAAWQNRLFAHSILDAFKNANKKMTFDGFAEDVQDRAERYFQKNLKSMIVPRESTKFSPHEVFLYPGRP
jgi:WD40 repeat protein